MNANGLFAISSLEGASYGYGLAARFGLSTETGFCNLNSKFSLDLKIKYLRGSCKGKTFQLIPLSTTVNSQ